MNFYGFYRRAILNHPFKISTMFVGDAIQAIFTLFIPFALKNLIDKMQLLPAETPVEQAWEALSPNFWWLVIIFIMINVGARLSGVSLAFLASVIRLKPRQELLTHLQNHSMNFFQTRHSGALGNKINEACTNLGHSLWTFCFDIWPVLIKAVVSIVLVFMASSQLAMIFGVWMFVYIVAMAYVGNIQFKNSAKVSDARSLITGKVVDLATNIYAVKSHGNEVFEKSVVMDASNVEREAIKRFNISREASGFFHSIMHVVIMSVMFYLTTNMFIEATLTLGEAVFIFSMMMIMTDNVRQILWGIVTFLEHLGAAKDGVDTVYKNHTIKNTQDAVNFKINDGESNHIKIRDVTFKYDGDQSDAILKKFNLEIPANQKIGVVGQSGAGKSTLVNLLLRFYDIQSGEIKIANQNIAHVTQESLRRHIAVIPQDTSLFHRTLMDNIRYGDLTATDEQVIEAAKRAYAHDFICSLPEGYHTMVGERGVRLSGGQRQRIAIARAILKDAPILVLDEATSALDSESEHLIQESLKGLMADKTVVAIAHRLSTISHLDRLIVMDQGEIVEDGTHEDLLKLDRHYAMLWSMQSGGFLKSN